MKRSSAFSVSLVPTRVKIQRPDCDSHPRRNTRAFLRDGDFPERSSFREFMIGFFSSFLNSGNIAFDDSSGFRVADLDHSGSRVLFGHVEAGKFGFESQFVNVEDTTKTKKREVSDCELLPFFFAMDFEPEKDCAILLTEQFGQYSPKGILMDQLRAYVAKILQGHRLSSETIVSEDVVRKVLDQHVKALRFHYDRVPSDVADGIDGDDAGHIEREGVMEVVIKSRNGVFPEWGYTFLNNVRQTGLTICDEHSTGLKVDMSVDGRTKTVNLGDLDGFNSSFLVDSRDDVEQNGHPSTERMRLEAEDAFVVCRKAIGWPKRAKCV